MTSPRRVRQAEAFRSAVEAHDFSRAESAFKDYVTWFRSASRNFQEIESARNLFRWGVDVTGAHRAHMAGELMRLRRVFNAYLPPRRTQTWRLDG